MASLINITIADKNIGEVYYKAKIVLYLVLVEVNSNRDDYCTVEYYLEVS